MGYLRPDWVTLEREGLSSNSRFPTDAAHIVRVSENLPEPDWKRRFSHTFFAEAVSDLLYYLPTVFFWFLYPHYRRHGLFHPLAEYAGWIIRLMTGSRRARAAEASIRDLIGRDTRFMVYPLQLQTDYQLRSHSPFARQQDAIRTVLDSFVANAPAQMHLVIKIHPLMAPLYRRDIVVSGCGGPRTLHRRWKSGDADRCQRGHDHRQLERCFVGAAGRQTGEDAGCCGL
jgi:capsular polysaccharide export protein